MFIVMVATECAPVAQAGGLGEVVFGLSRELELRGHAVEIILPKYDCLRYDQIDDLTRARRLPSPQLVGTPERVTLDVNALGASGVAIVGRLSLRNEFSQGAS